MAMVHEIDWAPYIEYSFRNRKTLETKSINAYRILNAEQHYLPTNDNREINDL